jgi:CRISPR/Cas system-associated exonuclease Cas4 (RecB family)
MTEAPPRTSDLLLLWDQQRDRSKQTVIGWSEIGGCRKRAGYRLAGTTPTNPSSSMQAILGTAVHDAVAGAIETVANGSYITEAEVAYAEVVGHLDRFHIPTGTLVDVKTTSSRWLEHIKLHGPDDSHRMQLAGYAAALTKEGHTVRRMRIDYIARDTGEEFNWPNVEGAPFIATWVREGLNWLKQVRDTDLDMLPRDYMPDSNFCRNCPFRDPCWEGAPSERTPLSVLYIEDPDAEKWADALWTARAEEKDAKTRAKKAAGALEALRPMDGTGRVQCGERTLDFRTNGIYFVSGAAPIPAVGFEDGDEAGAA